MPERKKGDRKRGIDRNKMERAEKDERQFIEELNGVMKPNIAFDKPITTTDKLEKIKKPTDDDLK